MTLNFPPRPTHEREIEMLVEILASVVDGRTAVYLSAPITSGKRFSDWHTQRNANLDESHPQYWDEHRHAVVEPNREHAQSLTRALRQELRKVLIDPTALVDLLGWTQDDYRYLWARVIERYVDTVVLIDGWQYSNGCAYEFLIAHRSGAKVFTENLLSLTLEEGEQLIRAALAEMQTQSLSPIFFEHVVAELTKLRL